MFEFSDSEYKWCGNCGGNIRVQSPWCKLCREAIGSKFFGDCDGYPMAVIDDCARWLPAFNSTVKMASPELQARLKKVDDDTPPPTIGIPDGADPITARYESRDAEVCGHEPPSPSAAGLLWDILVSIHERGQSLTDLCRHPKLQLLEITPQEILAEYELRKAEIENNQRCSYCSEFIISAYQEPCRYCDGFRDSIPKPRASTLSKTLDVNLLRDVILYEAAMRTISGGEQLTAEILAANHIENESIDREVLKQRTTPTPPMSRFLRRMNDLGLKSYLSFNSLAISEIIDLANSLKGRSEEAIIVLEHAIERGESSTDAQYDVARAMEYLSLLYRKCEQFEKAKELHEQARELQTYGMDEETKRLMREMTMDVSELASAMGLDADPEARLISFEESMQQFQEKSVQMAAMIDSMIPGLGSALSSITQNLSSGLNNMSRLRLEADVAKQNGNLELAEAKYQEILQTSVDDYTGVMLSSSIYAELAWIYLEKGDAAHAESILKQGMDKSRSLYEVKPDLGAPVYTTARFAYAKFLKKTNRLDEALGELRVVANMQEAMISNHVESYGGERIAFSEELIGVLQELSEVLNLLGQTEIADGITVRATQLAAEHQSWKDKQQARAAKEKEFGF